MNRVLEWLGHMSKSHGNKDLLKYYKYIKI